MVYVDPLYSNGWVLRGTQIRNCHLFADTLEELHAFATKIGMKRAWFQAEDRLPHYDLTPKRREHAVLLGAREVSRRELVEFMRSHQKVIR